MASSIQPRPENLRPSRLKIFFGSPDDVLKEREIAYELVYGDFGITRSSVSDLIGEIVLRSFKEVPPDAGRAQDLVNPEVDDCDLFIGALSRKWGTPTGEYSSGFEEEFERVYERRKRTGKPIIWLMFKELDEASLKDPGPELAKVLAFKDEKRKDVRYENFNESNWREILQRLLTDLIVKRAVDTRGEVMIGDTKTLPPHKLPSADDPTAIEPLYGPCGPDYDMELYRYFVLAWFERLDYEEWYFVFGVLGSDAPERQPVADDWYRKLTFGPYHSPTPTLPDGIARFPVMNLEMEGEKIFLEVYVRDNWPVNWGVFQTRAEFVGNGIPNTLASQLAASGRSD
jgi:hypothetical protein